MPVRGCGVTADGKMNVELSDGKSYVVRPWPGVRADLEEAGLRGDDLDDVSDSLEKACSAGSIDTTAFMKRCRMHEFRRELDRLRISSRLSFAKSLAVLALVTVAEPVMRE